MGIFFITDQDSSPFSKNNSVTSLVTNGMGISNQIAGEHSTVDATKIILKPNAIQLVSATPIAPVNSNKCSEAQQVTFLNTSSNPKAPLTLRNTKYVTIEAMSDSILSKKRGVVEKKLNRIKNGKQTRYQTVYL